MFGPRQLIRGGEKRAHLALPIYSTASILSFQDERKPYKADGDP